MDENTVRDKMPGMSAEQREKYLEAREAANRIQNEKTDLEPDQGIEH